jgi:hypothetical protein
MEGGMLFDIENYRHCFSTKENEAYFWHGRTNGIGGQLNAQRIAKEHNGKTLEMKVYEHLRELEKFGVDYDEDFGIIYTGDDPDFWDKCSKAFAEQASGDIHVIEGTDKRKFSDGRTVSEEEFTGSVYRTVEYPALANKEKVNSITSIDAYSGKETGKVERFDREVSEDFGMSL